MSRQRRFTGRMKKPFLNVWPASLFIALVLVSFSLPSQGSSDTSKSEETPSKNETETTEYSYEDSSTNNGKRNSSISGEDSLEEFESEESAYYRKRRQLFREDIPHHRPLSGNTYAQHHGFPHAGRFNENGRLIVPPMPNPASAHHEQNNHNHEHEHNDDFHTQNEIVHEYPVEYGKFLHHSHGHEIHHGGEENYAPAHGYGPPEHHAIIEEVPHHQNHQNHQIHQNHQNDHHEEYIPVYEKPKEVINLHNQVHHGHGHHHQPQGYRPNYGNVEVLPIPIPLPVYHGGHYKSHRHHKYRHNPRPKYRHKRPRHHHHHYQLYPIRHYGRHKIIHIPIIRYGAHRNKGHKGAFAWFADFPLRRKLRRRRNH